MAYLEMDTSVRISMNISNCIEKHLIDVALDLPHPGKASCEAIIVNVYGRYFLVCRRSVSARFEHISNQVCPARAEVTGAHTAELQTPRLCPHCHQTGHQ